MEQILSLLTLVVALLTAVQQNPDLPPQIRAQALSIAQQSIVMVANAENPAAPAETPSQTPEQPTTPPDQQTPPAQSAATSTPETPVQISGSIDTTVVSFPEKIARGASNVAVIDVQFTNNRNEPIELSRNVGSYVRVVSSIAGWAPEISGLYRGGSLSSPHTLTRIPANSTGLVRFYVSNAPAEAGTFKVVVDPYRFDGLTTGDNLSAQAVETGSIIVE